MKKLFLVWVAPAFLTALLLIPLTAKEKKPGVTLGKMFVQNAKTGKWQQLTSQPTTEIYLYCQIEEGAVKPCVIDTETTSFLDESALGIMADVDDKHPTGAPCNCLLVNPHVASHVFLGLKPNLPVRTPH